MEQTGAPGLWDRLLGIPRQVVYLVIGVAVVLPFIVPMGFPIIVSHRTQQLYDFVASEEDLPPGSVVCIAFDYGPASMAELQPMAVALARHCFSRDIGLIGVALVPWGVPLCDEAFALAAADYGKQEHVDYVNLGYRPGGSPVIMGMGEDIHVVFKQDARKKPIGEIPLMEGIHTYQDIGIIIDLASGATPQSWIAYAGARYGATVSAGVTAVMALDMYPYLQSGQLVGMLGGLKGAAEYEKLIEKPAEGALGMDSQTLAHGAIVLFVVAANLGFLMRRWRTSGRQAP